MTRTSWVEICVSDFAQSITWFEQTLGFRVVARDANEYAELSRGETTIQLAADDAPYWASEHPRLQPPGQRGSGVEIVLLVENVDAVYHQAQNAKADIVRELADFPWHMRQFWVRHPDGYLIRPAQKILSVNPALYHRQVANAFQRATPHITEELAKVKETADTLVQQQDYLGAAAIYETLITEIFEESHLYYDEEAEYDDYYEGERYYPEEEGLEEFVGKCIEALGHCLADERADRVARENIIAVLFDLYQHDLNADNSHGFTASASNQLVRYVTSLERDTLAEQIHAILTDEDKKVTGSLRQAYGQFLVDLEKETLSDEAYLQICRETGLTTELIDRLLTLGRIDEAERATHPIDDVRLLKLADLFIQHTQDAVAERLMRERIKEKPAVHILEWLQTYYQARNNHAAEFEATEMLFRTQPLLTRYQELRHLAKQLDRWETVQPALLAFLEQAHNTSLLIQIALDEGEIDTALKLLKGMATKDSYGYTYTSGYVYYYGSGIDLAVARAAEETRPREAIQLYQQHAERLIALRDRKNYQAACTYLAKMRALYVQQGEDETWTRYIATLREQNRNLRALKEELAKAGL
ncbi:glyoxalase [Ktedonobacteria bacterium brp13]|nr:glyoxalase [Ktedonobacteria bacterium brp13]